MNKSDLKLILSTIKKVYEIEGNLGKALYGGEHPCYIRPSELSGVVWDLSQLLIGCYNIETKSQAFNGFIELRDDWLSGVYTDSEFCKQLECMRGKNV